MGGWNCIGITVSLISTIIFLSLVMFFAQYTVSFTFSTELFLHFVMKSLSFSFIRTNLIFLSH